MQIKSEGVIAENSFPFLIGKIPYYFALGDHDKGSEAGKFAAY